MRVLFSCTATEGHFAPLMPLATAFRAQDHDVAFATAGTHEPRVRAAGFELLAAGLDPAEIQRRHAPYRAQLQTMPIAERRPFSYTSMFALVDAPSKIVDLHEAAERWRPDLIVHDAGDLSAPAVGESLDIRTVNHGFGQVIPPACLERAAGEMADLWDALGVDPGPYCGMYRGGYIDIWPPSLGGPPTPAGTAVHRERPASTPPAGGDGWRPSQPDRPTIYLTLGTVLSNAPLVRLVLDALADVDCNVLATVGRHIDPAELAPWPANATVEQFVPQAEVLPHCTLVIAHGGSGSTLGALAHGLPLLFLPHAADQFDNSAACQAAGVGLTVMPGVVDAPTVREATENLLADERFRTRAQAVAAEIAAMQSPDELAAHLAAAS